jgi:hypothetical protein
MMCKCGHSNTTGESLHLNDMLILWPMYICVCMHSDNHIITFYGQCIICIMNMMQVSYLRHSQCKVTNTERGEHHKGLREQWEMLQCCSLCADCSGVLWCSAHFRSSQKEVPGTESSLWQEGACVSGNWCTSWKTGIHFCILFKYNFINCLYTSGLLYYY